MGEDTSNEYYYHATIEISADGKIEGTFFSNLDSTEDQVIEYRCSWNAKIKRTRIYRRADGSYFFYLKDIKYDKQPDTTEEADGKTIKYVYAFGLSEKADNKIVLYPPETSIDSLKTADSEFDMRQFLTMMRKDGEAEKLDCFLLKGKDDSCYISITDEEAKMAEQEQGEQPEHPEEPQRPEKPSGP